MKIYTYVVARDYGFAPNPFFGCCTLATCKPKIRKGAKIGDWVVGTGSKENDRAGYLVYAMKVDEESDFDRYWADERFADKKPKLTAPGAMFRFGDNIYHHANDGSWIQEDSHHSLTGGALNVANLKRDTGRTDRVLISRHFTYWGGSGPKVPAQFRNYQGKDIVCPARDHRCNFPEALKREFIKWVDGLSKGYVGEPHDFKTYVESTR